MGKEGEKVSETQKKNLNGDRDSHILTGEKCNKKRRKKGSGGRGPQTANKKE